MKLILALLIALLWTATTAYAAQAPVVPPYATLGGQSTISVSNSSSRVALPANTNVFGAVTLFNAGSTDLYVALGDVTVAATTSNTLIKAGTSIAFWVNQNTYVAAITASSTSTLVLYQASGPINLTGAGSSGGGGGNVTIVGPLGQTTMSASVPVTLASNQSSVGVTATPASAAATTTSVSVGVSSAQALAGGTRKYLSLANQSATAVVACALAGTAVLNAAGSLTLPPYSSYTWESSYVPSDAVNCIASAATTPLTIVSQ